MSKTTPMNRQILPSGTAAAVSEEFTVLPDAPVTVVGVGTFASNTLDFQISYDGGSTFVDCVVASATKSLSAVSNIETIYGPGVYRLNKAESTNALSAYILY